MPLAGVLLMLLCVLQFSAGHHLNLKRADSEIQQDQLSFAHLTTAMCITAGTRFVPQHRK